MNLAHRLTLLEAGHFALNRKANENAVKDKFDEAIRQATRIGSRQDAALANWHAGEYSLPKKKDGDWASYYVKKVHWLYRDWEAHRVCQPGTRPLWFRDSTKDKKTDRDDMVYDRGGVPQTVITEPRMATPWDYPKEKTYTKPSTSPTGVPQYPAWDSTREPPDKGLYESYPTKNGSVNPSYGTKPTSTHEKG